MPFLRKVLLSILVLIGFFVSFFFINLALERFGYAHLEGVYNPIPLLKSGLLMQYPVKNNFLDKEIIEKTADDALRKELSEEIKTWNLDYKKEDEKKILDELVSYLKERELNGRLNENKDN